MSMVVVDSSLKEVTMVYCYQNENQYTNLSMVILEGYDTLCYEEIKLYSYKNFRFTVHSITPGKIVCEFVYDQILKLPVKQFFIIDEEGNLIALSGKHTPERIMQYLNGFISQNELRYYCSYYFNVLK